MTLPEFACLKRLDERRVPSPKVASKSIVSRSPLGTLGAKLLYKLCFWIVAQSKNEQLLKIFIYQTIIVLCFVRVPSSKFEQDSATLGRIIDISNFVQIEINCVAISAGA